MSEQSDLNQFCRNLPRDYKTAMHSRTMSQDEKVKIVAAALLTRLHRDGSCTIADLETDLAERVTGRLGLTLGAGVGGRGGMRVLRDRAGNVIACRDNALNLLDRLGADGLHAWLTAASVDLAAFQSWLASLPQI